MYNISQWKKNGKNMKIQTTNGRRYDLEHHFSSGILQQPKEKNNYYIMKTLFIKISDFMYSNSQSFFLFIESCVHKSLNFYSYIYHVKLEGSINNKSSCPQCDNLLTAGRFNPVEAKKLSYECVLIGTDVVIILWKHSQKNLQETFDNLELF